MSQESAVDYPTLAEAIEAFAETLVAKSPRTAANYLSALTRFLEYLLPEPFAAFQESPLAKVPHTAANYVPELTRFLNFLATSYPADAARTTASLPAEVVERFYSFLLRNRGREKRSTAMAYTSEVRTFFRFLDRRRWLNPEVSYERLKDGLREHVGRQNYKTPRVDNAVALVVLAAQEKELPPDDDKHKYQRLEALRDRAILVTLFITGMRREELSRMNRTDIQDGRYNQGIITGKGDKERTVFFDESSLVAIRAYLQARHDSLLPLFLRHDPARGKPGLRGEHWRLSPQSIWLVVKKYARVAGVDATTHQLRHLKATVMLNQGAQLSEVQDILGHSSPETTKKIYAHYTTQYLREAFDKFSLPVETVANRSGRPRNSITTERTEDTEK